MPNALGSLTAKSVTDVIGSLSAVQMVSSTARNGGDRYRSLARRLGDNGDKRRPAVPVQRHSSHRGLMTPGEQLLEPRTMLTRHFRNRKLARIRLMLI